MKNPTATIVESSGTIDLSNAQTMGIDDSGMATVLQILSNMYSNGSLAVVREYSSNARDSHVEAGNTDPIEVTLPTIFDPRLIVQDYGVGLSRQEVMDVYAKYGASTKRDSNDQIGAFGIGSKSAFTVGNQFIIVAVKAGWKSTVLFSLNSAGMPIVEVVDHSATDEHNGVRVEVGVRDVNAIKTAATNLFSTWPVGSVLVDGEAPWSIWDSCVELDAGMWRQEGADHGYIDFIMGGVNYNIPRGIVPSLNDASRLAIENLYSTKLAHHVVVPIGSLDITPSREELRNTPLTIATIERELLRVVNLIKAEINVMISGANRAIDAVVALRTIKDTMGEFAIGHTEWNGKPFGKATVEFPFTQIYLYSKTHYAKKSATRSELIKFHTNDNLLRNLIITDVPADKHIRVQHTAKKFLEYRLHEEQSWNHIERLVLAPDASGEQEWFYYGADGPIPTMSYGDYLEYIQEITPISQRSSNTEETRYHDVKTGVRIGLKALKAEYKQGKTVYLLSKGLRHLAREPLFAKTLDEARIIVLEGGQQVDTFLRRFPLAKDLRKDMMVLAEAELAKTDGSDESLIHCHLYHRAQNNRTYEVIRILGDNITNPVVKEHVDYMEAIKYRLDNEADRLKQLTDLYRLAGRDFPNSPLLPDQEDFLLNKLPLLSSFNRYGLNETIQKHLVMYINSVEID